MVSLGRHVGIFHVEASIMLKKMKLGEGEAQWMGLRNKNPPVYLVVVKLDVCVRVTLTKSLFSGLDCSLGPQRGGRWDTNY